MPALVHPGPLARISPDRSFDGSTHPAGELFDHQGLIGFFFELTDRWLHLEVISAPISDDKEG